jgi:Dyp-type peroxidase family
MTVTLDLADIQGNILAGYGKQGFPIGRLILFHIDAADDDETRAENGRRFIDALRPKVTTALRWDGKYARPGEKLVPMPGVTLNIAISYQGLAALGVSTRTLRVMPDPFIDGMAKRARMLGDDFAGPGWRDKWDEVWQADATPAHILVSLNAQPDRRGEMDDLTAVVEAAARAHGVSLLEGHNRKGKPRAKYQELSALFDGETGKPLPTEHFGFTDGISDPVFESQYLESDAKLVAQGNGAVDGEGNWRPLATGEFLLGYPDEAQETSGPITPIPFFRNGTFMAYRKLHENVWSWRSFIDKAAADFQRIAGIDTLEKARELLTAKMIGRWRNGVPLAKAPTFEEKAAFDANIEKLKAELATLKQTNGDPARQRELVKEIQLAFSDFRFADDARGDKCPLTSHVRRANTRDGLDPRAKDPNPISRGGSVLNNRRRILRRGLPYGDSTADPSDDGDHGIIFLALCADLFRQFEFVQQQWVNYGLDARAGSDTCPIVGNHSQGADTADPEARKRNGLRAKFVVPADPKGDKPPFIIDGLPQLVEARGGEYFFVPSLTALRMIAEGAVDPT